MNKEETEEVQELDEEVEMELAEVVVELAEEVVELAEEVVELAEEVVELAEEVVELAEEIQLFPYHQELRNGNSTILGVPLGAQITMANVQECPIFLLLTIISR